MVTPQQAMRDVLHRVGPAELFPAGVMGLAERPAVVLDPDRAERQLARSGPARTPSEPTRPRRLGPAQPSAPSGCGAERTTRRRCCRTGSPPRCTSSAHVGRSTRDRDWTERRRGPGVRGPSNDGRGRCRVRTPTLIGHNLAPRRPGGRAPDRPGPGRRHRRGTPDAPRPGASPQARSSSASVDALAGSQLHLAAGEPASSFQRRRASSTLRWP